MRKIFIVSRMLILICALTPFTARTQTKYLVSSHRVFPKVDKVLEFEKAVAAHAQKYHSGTSHWRVFMIQSGPDIGGYHITEGPTSWETEDTRGDLGTEHNVDWNRTVAIHLTDRQSGGYYVYNDSLSTVALGDFSEKINISHVFPKMAKGEEVISIIKKLKKYWTANGITVAVYTASSSGPAQYTLVTRYKQGLKERAPNFRKPFKELYESANGAGSHAAYLKDVAEFTNDVWSELLILRPELSSK